MVVQLREPKNPKKQDRLVNMNYFFLWILYIYFVSKKCSFSDLASSMLSITLIFFWWILWTILPIRYFFLESHFKYNCFTTIQFFLTLIRFLLLTQNLQFYAYLLFFTIICFPFMQIKFLEPSSCDETNE